MKKRVIFFFDVDGTLYDSLNKVVRPSTEKALKALHERDDTVIAVATGRAFYMLDIIEGLKPYIDVYITINGRIIYNKDTIIHDEPMKAQTIERFKKQFQAHGLNFGFIGKHEQAVYRLDSYAKCMFDKARLPRPMEGPDFNLTHDVYQMWAFGAKRKMEVFNMTHEEYEVVPWLKDGFDLIHKSFHKGSGVLKVLNHLSLNETDAYSFGDADNDISMFEVIEKSIAMGNGTRSLKTHAWSVTDSADQEGLANALKSLNFIK